MLKSKEQVFNSFRTWQAMIEKQIMKNIKRLTIDNRLEFYNIEFDKFHRKHEITRQRMVARTPVEWVCRKDKENAAEQG